MSSLVRRLLDVLYVRPCIVCGKPVRVSDELSLCCECSVSIHRLGQTNKTAERIIVSALPYEGNVRNAMSKFKFRNKKYYGRTFAHVLHERLRVEQWWDEVEGIVCIPMKGRNRLYNQSAVVAGHVAELAGIPFYASALVKVKDNPPFYKLKRAERLRLIQGAFDIGENAAFAGKTVLLIDDIYTTGITINECRRLLLKNGAVAVYCATVCYNRGIRR